MSLKIKAILKHSAESGGVAAPLQRGWVCGCKNSPSPDDGVGAAPGPLSATAKRTAVRERRGGGGGGGGGVERDGGVKERGERRGVGGEREIRTHARALSLSNTRTFARVLNSPPPFPPPAFPTLALSLSFCIMYKPVCPLETLFSSTKRDIDDSLETQKQLNHSHSCDLCKSCEWK